MKTKYFCFVFIFLSKVIAFESKFYETAEKKKKKKQDARR